MLGGQSETLFYIVKTDDDKYSVFNIVTDKIILNDVTKKESESFLERNNPNHPTMTSSSQGFGSLGISLRNPIVSPTKAYSSYDPYVSTFSMSDTYTYDTALDDLYNTVMDYSFDIPSWRCEWSPPQVNQTNSEEKDNVFNFTKKRRVDDFFNRMKKNKDEDDDKI
jgi:hypothetical protein